MSTEKDEKILKSCTTLLHQQGISKDVQKEGLDSALKNAFEEDRGALWTSLYSLLYQNSEMPRSEFFTRLKEHLHHAFLNNKLNIFMAIPELINKYLNNGIPGTPDDAVQRSYLETVLVQKVAADDFEWVARILTHYADLFLPDFIIEKVSPTKPEMAYWLYHHQDLRAAMKSKALDSVLVVACRVQDEKMVQYCLAQEADRRKINANKEHLPALFVAIDLKDKACAELLLAAGASINVEGGEGVEGQHMTAGHRAIMTYELEMVRFVTSKEGFDWNRSTPMFGSLLRVACSEYGRLHVPVNREKAFEIFKFVLDHFRKNRVPAFDSQITDGSTTLTYAIVNARPCAGLLIAEGMGVFDLDQAKRSPLYWARYQKDKGLEYQLKEYYKEHVLEIVHFFLNSDPRVCWRSADNSSCSIVLEMVSEWVDLKEEMFRDLGDLIKDVNTPVRQLKDILELVEDPNSALSQFFALGHGKSVFQSASPWPRRFAPLIVFMRDQLAAKNSFIESNGSARFLFE